MHRQRPAVIQEEQPVNTPQKQPTHRVGRARVVYDPDPYAHLTPAERYAQAIQRRDALRRSAS